VTFADALEAHEMSLDAFGGLRGISNIDNILGALGRPYHGYHRMIWAKGAALLHGVASSHGFNDGNKRTAWLLTELLFKRCGYVLQLGESDRLDDVVVAVVEGTMSQDDLESWLKGRTVRC
jgi:death-on-curing protein